MSTLARRYYPDDPAPAYAPDEEPPPYAPEYSAPADLSWMDKIPQQRTSSAMPLVKFRQFPFLSLVPMPDVPTVADEPDAPRDSAVASRAAFQIHECAATMPTFCEDAQRECSPAELAALAPSLYAIEQSARRARLAGRRQVKAPPDIPRLFE